MNNQKGFTLIELIIVVAIISILLGTAIPNIIAYRDRYREQDLMNQEYVINKALIQYYAFTGEYPNQARTSTSRTITAGELTILENELKNKTNVSMDTDKYDFLYEDSNNPGVYTYKKIHVAYK